MVNKVSETSANVTERQLRSGISKHGVQSMKNEGVV